jgi:steroid delta-isomerase-like uncharacterized protein
MTAYANGFPDLNVTIKDMIADGDRVIIRTTNRTTNTSPFRGMPTTGKQTIVHQASIFRIADGKIIEVWTVSNQLIVLQQMSLIPPLDMR